MSVPRLARRPSLAADLPLSLADYNHEMVTVLFFASLREMTGTDRADFESVPGESVAQLFLRLQTRWPQIAVHRSTLLVAVNEDYASWETLLSDGDEVALFPPVSGGQGWVTLVSSPIDRGMLARNVESPEAGAVVTFDGTVRDQARGKRVTHLYYESYGAMALKEMEKLRAQALERWPLCRVAIAHRVGRMEIGDSSVFIAVSAAHRAEAFEACRFLIDTLKRTVPIWKKEYYDDGECWIESYAGRGGDRDRQ